MNKNIDKLFTVIAYILICIGGIIVCIIQSKDFGIIKSMLLSILYVATFLLIIKSVDNIL